MVGSSSLFCEFGDFDFGSPLDFPLFHCVGGRRSSSGEVELHVMSQVLTAIMSRFAYLI